MSEFKLSEKIVFNPKGINWVSERNVKEFIKRLKEVGKSNQKSEDGEYIYILSEEEINKLVGDLK